MSGYFYLAIIAGAVVALAAAMFISKMLIERVALGGKAEERARQAEAARDDTQKQAEIMLTEKTVEDVAKDLDDGTF